jgi:carboxylesterase
MPESNIMTGAEPFFFEGTDVGCLISHGFTGSPQSMRFLGEYLAEEGGLTVAGPRLKGHGTSVEDMARSSAEDWIRSVEAGLQTLRERCSKIFMTGLSMGGTLTLYIAAMHPDVIRGAVPINGAVFVNNPDLAGLAFMGAAPATVPGVGGDIKKPGVTELAYEDVPVPAIRQIYALMSVTRELLPRVKCPLLVIQSRDDHVVVPDNAPFIMNNAGAEDKRLLWLENSYHVATLDHDKELIARETLQFIRRLFVDK